MATCGEAKHTGVEASEARRWRSLEEENRRLKQRVAEQALALQVWKAVLAKKVYRPRRGGHGKDRSWRVVDGALFAGSRFRAAVLDHSLRQIVFDLDAVAQRFDVGRLQ